MIITGKFPKVVDFIGYALATLTLVSCIIVNGFYIDSSCVKPLLQIQQFFAFAFLGIYLVRFLNSQSKLLFIKSNKLVIVLMIFFLVIFIINNFYIFSPHYTVPTSRDIFIRKHWFFVFLQFFLIINTFITFTRMRDKWLLVSINPSRILVFSFFLTIVVGGLLLKLPRASTNLSWIDSFFLSTSAVCVTGLSTVDITQVLTFEGQFILMCLIQVGGLGIVTLTTFIVLFFQRGFRLKDQMMMKDMMDDENFSKISLAITLIMLSTFIIEFIGSIFLYISWSNMPMDMLELGFYAIFHSVSAYCNAGFSTFPLGLENRMFNSHYPTLIIVMLLIVLGGLGFYTYNYFLTGGKKKNQRMSLQVKMIVYGTIVLIFFGALITWIVQYSQWKDLPIGQQIVNSFFISITSRTAGFANVNMGTILYPTATLVILYMYIGASPNSTAGGIKITTVVTLLYSVFAFIRGKERVEIGWNTISKAVVRRSLVVFFISIVIIFSSGFLISIFETDKNIFDIYFEVVSAFGTTGLSRGITAQIRDITKMTLIFLMFAGRVGMFTLAVAINEGNKSEKYKFAETNIMVG